MTHTQYRDDHTALIPERAMAYDPKERKDGYTLNVSYFEQTGDGAVHTSVEDLLKWDENFYSGQVGGKDFLAELQEPGKLNSGKVLDYAKGLHIADYRGLHTVSHGGSWGGYRAELLRFPEQHFSVACLCNRGDANPTKRAVQVADIYLGSMMKPKEEKKPAEREAGEKKEIPLAAEQLRRYTGDYWSSELGVTYRIGIVDGKLRVVGMLDGGGFMHTSTLPPDGFAATGPDEFTLSKMGITIHFERDSNQVMSGFKLDAGRTLGMIFARRDGTEK
jgi:hypothetical protein